MVERRQKLKRGVIAVLAVFCAALILGFLSESRRAQTSHVVSRSILIDEMAKVLRTLRPVMRAGRTGSEASHSSISSADRVFQTGVLKKFPDGSFGLNEKVTRGEVVYYFGLMFNYINDNMVQPQLLFRGERRFADIPPGHWLEGSLQILDGTGALSCFDGETLKPDLTMTIVELRSIVSTLIEYLGENIAILKYDGTNLQVRLKGVMKPVSDSQWQVSVDGEPWLEFEIGREYLPEFSPDNSLRVIFRHPEYVDTVPVELENSVSAKIFIRLRRNYRNIGRSTAARVAELRGRLGESGVSKTDSENGGVGLSNPVPESSRERVRQRLAEIRARSVISVNCHPRTAVCLKAQPRKAEVNTERALRSKSDLVKVARAEINKPDSSRLYQDNARPPKTAGLKTVSASSGSVISSEVSRPVIIYSENLSENGNDSEFETMPEEQDSNSGETFEGRVIDAVTRKALEGATVVIDGVHKISDSNGRLSFKAANGAIVDVTGYFEGYEPIQLRHRTGYRPGPMVISLKPVMVSYSGRVLDMETGLPVVRAVIRVGNRTTRTAQDGSFSLDRLKPGYHQLSCFAPDYMKSHKIIFMDKDSPSPVRLLLRPLYAESPNAVELPVTGTDFRESHF